MDSFQNQSLFNFKKKLIKKTIVSSEKSLKNNSIFLNFLGIPLEIQTNSESLIKNIKETFPEAWLTDKQSSITLRLISPEDFNISNLDFCEESDSECWVESHPKGEYAIQRDFAANLIDNTVYMITELEIGDGIYNGLRWLIPRLLIQNQEVVLHSSCIIGKDGKAYFFLGPSGAGKSTITTFAKNRKVLGDDMNVLSFKDNVLQAKPAFLGGMDFPDLGDQDVYDVGGFYWLNQDTQTKLTTIPSSKKLTYLLSSYANLYWDGFEKELLEKTLLWSSKVAQEVPMEILNFKKDEEFWDVIGK